MDKKIDKQLKNLGRELQYLREHLPLKRGKQWTQQDVANELGIRYQSYQAYELGKAYPSLKNFLKLAKLFDVSLDSLVGKKDI
ncbi:MAG: helix-turn-helix transcriptional regulator [Clostridia bacterium]|nr:helix-turn-helix transcriptional regulator [Clostridia bacterium]